MDRTITVRGVGTATTKPDWVVLRLNLNSRDKEYDKAMELASGNIDKLSEALLAVGFEKDALKTVNFNVNTEYEGYHDEKGIYHNMFKGYCVYHYLSLEFLIGRLLGNNVINLKADTLCRDALRAFGVD